jgi:hypothetical protein
VGDEKRQEPRHGDSDDRAGVHGTSEVIRALASGQTLSDYLLVELERLAARPTRDEMLARLHRRKRVTLKTPSAVVIRKERESA